MNSNKRDFDTESATWDTPPRVKLAEDLAQAIIQHVPLSTDMDILDFGCGTGLVSLALHSRVRSVTGVDSSQGMLDVCTEKIRRAHITNVKTMCIDLSAGESLPGMYHLIITTMTLHHIKDVPALFTTLSHSLIPGGSVALADLEPDDGLFHANNDGVYHHGFERIVLRRMFTDAGFDAIHTYPAAEVVKPISDGSMRTFGIFLMTGQKG